MSEPSTPTLKAFARQLLACAGAFGYPAGTEDSRSFRTCEKLRGPLGSLIGVGGFRSLLSRALALAGEDIPWLCALHVTADGSLAGLETELAPSEVAAAELALMAQIAGLLVTFVGPALTMQLLRGIWPTIPDHDFGTGEPT